jgi:hypothetical protein
MGPFSSLLHLRDLERDTLITAFCSIPAQRALAHA